MIVKEGLKHLNNTHRAQCISTVTFFIFTYERIRSLVQFGLGPELESIRIGPGLLPDVQHLQRLPDAVTGAVAVRHVDGLQLRKISQSKFSNRLSQEIKLT